MGLVEFALHLAGLLAFFFKLVFKPSLFAITKRQQARQRVQRLGFGAGVGKHPGQQFLRLDQFW